MPVAWRSSQKLCRCQRNEVARFKILTQTKSITASRTAVTMPFNLKGTATNLTPSPDAWLLTFLPSENLPKTPLQVSLLNPSPWRLSFGFADLSPRHQKDFLLLIFPFTITSSFWTLSIALSYFFYILTSVISKTKNVSHWNGKYWLSLASFPRRTSEKVWVQARAFMVGKKVHSRVRRHSRCRKKIALNSLSSLKICATLKPARK